MSKREDWCDRSEIMQTRGTTVQVDHRHWASPFNLVGVHPQVDGQQISSTTPSVAT